jgi:hypothetical protein
VHSGFLQLPVVDEVSETVVEFIWWFAHGEKICFEVTFSDWDLSRFHVLVDLNGDSRKLVTADPSEYTEKIVFELF